MANISTIVARRSAASSRSTQAPRRTLAAVAFAIAVLTLAACGSSSTGTTGGGSHILRTALTADPSPLDPDTYYEAEGLAITNSTYEGLLTFADNSPNIIGSLATSWKVTDNAKTFTFKLRQGVKFSDGTPFDSTAAKASFQRRIDLKGGPSYMLAGVKSMSTPDPTTFVVKLKQSSQVFLSYLASPYGPMMTSPTAVKQHTVGTDHAAKWFGSHSAGTGAYVLSKVQRGALYELTANPYYHGTKPYYTTVDFKVVPSMETQRLQLQGGQQDLILQRLPQRDLVALQKASGVQVKVFPALFKAGIYVNPKSSVFGGANVRAALRASVDNQAVTKELYGDFGTTSTDVYPAGMLPAGAAPDKPTVNPSLLGPALAPFKGKKVTVGYYDASDQARVLAGRLQTQLESLGLKVTLRDYPPSIVFTLPTSPKQRPDLIVTGFNPDSSAPDTFARIYWYKNAPVNLMGCSAPTADRLLDKAASAPTAAVAVKDNVAAAEAYRASNCWIDTTDGKDVIVARSGITGWQHILPWVLVTRLSSLKAG